jgi:hypothetical protein
MIILKTLYRDESLTMVLDIYQVSLRKKQYLKALHRVFLAFSLFAGYIPHLSIIALIQLTQFLSDMMIFQKGNIQKSM